MKTTEMAGRSESEESLTVQIKKLIGYVSETSDEEEQNIPFDLASGKNNNKI